MTFSNLSKNKHMTAPDFGEPDFKSIGFDDFDDSLEKDNLHLPKQEEQEKIKIINRFTTIINNYFNYTRKIFGSKYLEDYFSNFDPNASMLLKNIDNLHTEICNDINNNNFINKTSLTNDQIIEQFQLYLKEINDLNNTDTINIDKLTQELQENNFFDNNMFLDLIKKNILNPVDTSKAEDAINPMDTSKAEDAINPVDTSKAEDAINPVDTSKAEDAINPVDTSKAEDAIERKEEEKKEGEFSQSLLDHIADMILKFLQKLFAFLYRMYLAIKIAVVNTDDKIAAVKPDNNTNKNDMNDMIKKNMNDIAEENTNNLSSPTLNFKRM